MGIMKKSLSILFFLIYAINNLTGANYLSEIESFLKEQSELPEMALMIVTSAMPPYHKGDQSALFHNGSLSKLFTTLLLLRLQEKGILSLDMSLDSYLPKELKGLTFRSLLSHTSGIQHRGFNTAETPGISHISFDEKWPPPFAVPKGEMILYSSEAFRVIEFILETILNNDFKLLMKEELFTPLALNHTQYFSASVLTGKNLKNDEYPDYRTTIPSAGNIITSATDMEKIINVLLGNNPSFIKKKTLQEIYTLTLSHFQNSYGRTPGFITRYYNENPLFFHDGAAPGTNSRLLILPEIKTALYIVYNHPSYTLKNRITEIFLKTHLGEEVFFSDIHEKNSLQPGYIFKGNYIPLSNSFSSMEKIMTLLAQERVSFIDTGLQINGEIYEYQEEGNYYTLKSHVPVSFRTIEDEQYMFKGNTPYKKVSFIWSQSFMALIFILALLSIAAGMFLFKKKAAALLNGLFLLVLSIYLYLLIVMDIWDIVYGLPLYFLAVQILLLIFTALRGAEMIYTLYRGIKYQAPLIQGMPLFLYILSLLGVLVMILWLAWFRLL